MLFVTCKKDHVEFSKGISIWEVRDIQEWEQWKSTIEAAGDIYFSSTIDSPYDYTKNKKVIALCLQLRPPKIIKSK